MHSFESEFRINTVHVQNTIGGGAEWECILTHKLLISSICNEALRKAQLEMSKINSWFSCFKFIVLSVSIKYLLTTDTCNNLVRRKGSLVRRKFLFIFPIIYQRNQQICHLYYMQISKFTDSRSILQNSFEGPRKLISRKKHLQENCQIPRTGRYSAAIYGPANGTVMHWQRMEPGN